MTPEYGAASQLEKIDMLDFADFVAINKFDRKGAADALRDVSKQVQRNKGDFTKKPDEMLVFGTMASRFNDDGVTALYQALLPRLQEHGLKTGDGMLPKVTTRHSTNQTPIVPPQRTRYLAEISETVRGYKKRAHEQARLARESQQLRETKRMLHEDDPERSGAKKTVERVAEEREAKQDKRSRKLLDMWPQMQQAYAGDEYVVKIRDRELRTTLTTRRCPAPRSARSRCRTTRTTANCCTGCCWKTCPAASRTPPACSPSSARTRTRRACSPARAIRSAPTAASSCSARACRPSACRPRSTG